MLSTLSLAFIPLFFNLGTGEMLLLAFVVLLLFGGRKIPELMRGLGKGVRSFRQGMSEVTDELNGPVESSDSKTPTNTGKE